MSSRTRLDSSEEYTIAWITALPHERAAATAVLDEEHDRPAYFEKHQHDTNAYTWGRIGSHNIVITSLPSGEYGSTIAATTANSLHFSLPYIRFGLMVGIGAGVPQLERGEDVRLGDIVVSQPYESSGGVVQYDLVKARQEGHFLTGHLAMPPEVLRKALAKLQAEHELRHSVVPSLLESMLQRFPKMAKRTLKDPGYTHPGADSDRLFAASSQHISGTDCRNCREDDVIVRDRRDTTDPEVHYGVIASGNTLVKSAREREEILERLPEHVRSRCLCIEMEAAGLMNAFPCMVIRGICDYADSHKNDRWQKYAAATAAAFAKEFLGFVDVQELQKVPELRNFAKNMASKVEQTRFVSMRTHSTVERSAEQAQLDKLYQWLSPSDPSLNHNKALLQRHNGTGRWFVESQSFRVFKEGTMPFLWLYGIPGCGKTILCASIIEELKKESLKTPTALLYFYFDFNDSGKQTLDSALRSLFWQMSKDPGGSSKVLAQLFASCIDGCDQPSTSRLIESFHHALCEIDHIRIVLDALDECTTKSDLMIWLSQLSRGATRHVQIIATSRKEHDIEIGFKKWLNGSATIPLRQLDVDPDIDAYVKYRLRNDPQLQRWQETPELQDKLETNLMKKSNGMFRWATCQLDALAECLDYPQLSEALASLPSTLDETYSRILDQIPERYKEQSTRLLQIVTWSKRPLLIEEVVDFLAVSPCTEPGFHKDNRMPLPREIIKLCPGLVTIVDVPRRETEFPVWDLHESETRMTQEIRLSHFSVKEYFTSDRIDKRIHNNLCQRPAAACIASVLLTYLLHLDLQMSLSELRSAFPLSWYSARHWMSFVRLAEAGSDTTQRLTMQLLLSQQQYKRWRSVHDPDKPWEEVPDLKSQPSPLYYASLEGLEHATVALLKKGANVNAQGGQYTTAICAASQRGHTQIVKLLLKHNADVNTRVLFGVNFEINFESDLKEYQMQLMLLEQQNRTRLHRARQLRDDTVAQATSSRYHGDIEGYLHPGYCSNALCAASAGNHMDIVSLLFEGGADLNIQCRQCGNALYTACDRGHMGVVEMLIENGAEVNAQGGYYGNALQAASTNGYERVVEVLLENGAEVNTQGGHYGNALQAACVGGYERIVELLLEKNADIDAWGGKYNDALQAANLCGFDKISRMLRRQLEDSCSRNQAKHLIEGQNQLSERSISSKRRCAGERLASCAVKGVTGDT